MKDSDHAEREGHLTSLTPDNCENDLHAIHTASDDVNRQESFISGSVCTDVNGERVNSTVQLLNSLRVFVPKDAPTTTHSATLPEIMYSLGSHSTPCSD